MALSEQQTYTIPDAAMERLHRVPVNDRLAQYMKRGLRVAERMRTDNYRMVPSKYCSYPVTGIDAKAWAREVFDIPGKDSPTSQTLVIIVPGMSAPNVSPDLAADVLTNITMKATGNVVADLAADKPPSRVDTAYRTLLVGSPNSAFSKVSKQWIMDVARHGLKPHGQEVAKLIEAEMKDSSVPPEETKLVLHGVSLGTVITDLAIEALDPTLRDAFRKIQVCRVSPFGLGQEQPSAALYLPKLIELGRKFAKAVGSEKYEVDGQNLLRAEREAFPVLVRELASRGIDLQTSSADTRKKVLAFLAELLSIPRHLTYPAYRENPNISALNISGVVDPMSFTSQRLAATLRQIREGRLPIFNEDGAIIFSSLNNHRAETLDTQAWKHSMQQALAHLDSTY